LTVAVTGKVGDAYQIIVHHDGPPDSAIPSPKLPLTFSAIAGNDQTSNHVIAAEKTVPSQIDVNVGRE
jgi:hypothetical protein